jgi:hypothetical protein
MVRNNYNQYASKHVLDAAGVHEDEDPYIELVCTAEKSVLATQLRAGARLAAACRDFIPRKETVLAVANVGGSLLEWEASCQGWAKLPGMVIWHPGGSMTDHYAVHARTFNIPIITTFEPKIGDELVPVEGQPILDPKAVLRGIAKAGKYTFPNLENGGHAAHAEAAFMLACLHHSPVFDGPDSEWLGIGVGLMLRLGSIALRGEARHILNSHKSREDVYHENEALPLKYHAAGIRRLINTFQYGSPGVQSVGGDRWTICAQYLRDMFVAVRELAQAPTLDNVNALIREFNKAVNLAHNNGWWMNKFADAALFNDIPKGIPSRYIGLVPVLWEMSKIPVDFALSKSIENMAKWSLVNDQFTAVLKPKLEWEPFGLNMTFQIKGIRPLKVEKPIPLTAFVPFLAQKFKSAFSLQERDGRLSLILEQVGAPEQVLWQDRKVKVPKNTILEGGNS